MKNYSVAMIYQGKDTTND